MPGGRGGFGVTRPLLEARGLTHTYRDPVTGARTTVVDDVSFEVHRAESVGVLGASGAGKSTLTRLLLGLESPDRGHVLFDTIDLAASTRSRMRAVRRRMQAVFQDPRESLNPHLRVETVISEPLLARDGCSEGSRRARVTHALEMVGLSAAHARRYPGQLSGGERQRVAIARALAPEPDLVILDEPVSSLDGPVRNHIIRLLAELKSRLDLTILMVSHDVRSVAALTTRVMVMLGGTIVEVAGTPDLLERLAHPFTRALLAAVPQRGAIPEVPPAAGEPAPGGCSCRRWCPLADWRCEERPVLSGRSNGRLLACWAVEPE